MIKSEKWEEKGEIVEEESDDFSEDDWGSEEDGEAEEDFGEE